MDKLTKDEAIEEAKDQEESQAYKETKKAIEALRARERDLKWEIRQREKELEMIQKTYIKLAYILGGGNPDHVIKPEDIEDDRDKNKSRNSSKKKR